MLTLWLRPLLIGHMTRQKDQYPSVSREKTATLCQAQLILEATPKAIPHPTAPGMKKTTVTMVAEECQDS